MSFLESLDSSIAAHQQQATGYANYRHRHGLDIVLVSQAFEPIKDNVIRVDIDSDCVDINIAGGLETLTGAFRAFRNLGYAPRKSPTRSPSSPHSRSKVRRQPLRAEG